MIEFLYYDGFYVRHRIENDRRETVEELTKQCLDFFENNITVKLIVLYGKEIHRMPHHPRTFAPYSGNTHDTTN